MRLSRCEVRDHINYRKNDRWRSHRFYRALQRLKSPMRYVCEIFGAPRFSSFSTQSDAKRTLDERRCQLPGAYDWAVATCGITSKKESRALRFADVPRQRHDQIGLTEDGRQSEKSWQPEHHATLDSELFQNSSSNCCPVPETMPTCPSA